MCIFTCCGLVSGQEIERDSSRDVPGIDFSWHDAYSDNKRGERDKSPKSSLADGNFYESHVDQAEDPHEAGVTDVEAHRREGELVHGAADQRRPRISAKKLKLSFSLDKMAKMQYTLPVNLAVWKWSLVIRLKMDWDPRDLESMYLKIRG